MSILHRAAYLSLSALLAVVPAACGGDDDDDDTTDDGGAADAGDDGGEADAGEPDAGGDPDAGEADAAPVEGIEYLLGLDLAADTMAGAFGAGVRLIATVNVDGATADFALQPVLAPQCVTDTPEMDGLPVGDLRIESDIPIAKDGTFTIDLAAATLPAGSVGSDDTDLPCGFEIISDLTVTGQVQASGAPCGTVDGNITAPVPGTAQGTFGSVLIDPPGTVGPDLPDALIDCE